MNSHHTHEQFQRTQSITEFKTHTKHISRLRRLAGSPFPPGSSSKKPRIGLTLMRRLAAQSMTLSGFLEFFQKCKNEKGLIRQRHHIHALQYKINYKVCIHLKELP